MNVALVGPGAIAEDHARAIWELGVRDPDLTLRAVMGPQREAAQAFAWEHGASYATYATTDLDELLDDAPIDAVIISLLVGEEDTLLLSEHGLRGCRGALALAGENRPILEQDAEFFAAVREGRDPAVSARSVRPATAVLQAAQDQLDAWTAQAGWEARHPHWP